MFSMSQLNLNRGELGEVGLGCWQLGGDCWGSVTDEVADSILSEAVASGVRFFDTADVYGAGISERRLGRFFTSSGSSRFIATKIGRFGDPGWPANFEKGVMRRHIEACLERLQVGSLDLVQLHCLPTEEYVRGAVFESLREFQSEGLIRRWGVSVESIEEGLLCLTQPGLASLQVIFNALRQKAAKVLLPRAQQMGVAIIVRLPLASGLLSGKMTAATSFDASDHRSFNANGAAFHVGETFNGIPFALGVSMADRLKADLPEGSTLAQASIRWILDHPAVTAVIPGASKLGQLPPLVAARRQAALSSEVHASWREFYDSEVESHIRGNL